MYNIPDNSPGQIFISRHVLTHCVVDLFSDTLSSYFQLRNPLN